MSIFDIDKWAEEMAGRILDQVCEENYSSILKLLEAKNKRDAERLGASLTISEAQFASLVLNVSIYRVHGYSYQSYYKTHMAADLTEERLEKYINDKDIGKIIQKTFDERKHNCFHLFERGSEWHLFYFNFSDVKGDHWEQANIFITFHIFGVLIKMNC